MLKIRLAAAAALLVGAAIGYGVYAGQMGNIRPFKLGLDLSGGTQLVYRADTNAIPSADVTDSMSSLRDTIERSVNLFGVGEPIVQTEKGGTFAGQTENRLIVELPGITDTEKAIAMIGQTPVLEFRLLKKDAPTPSEDQPAPGINDTFDQAVITGKHLDRAEPQFGNGTNQLSNEPVVIIHFNSDGAKIFGDMTTTNVG